MSKKKSKKESIFPDLVASVSEVTSQINTNALSAETNLPFREEEVIPPTKEKTMSKTENRTEVRLGDGAQTTFVRPSKLAGGEKFEGVYVGTTPNKFDESKPDYNLKTMSGDKIVINHTGKLAKLLEQVKEGDTVEIEYLGMQEIKGNSKFKGKKAHDFKVVIIG
jgi:hypothetical protein